MRLVRLVPALVVLVLGACAVVDDREGVDVSRGNPTTQAHLRQQVDEMRYMRGQELMRRMETLASLGQDGVDAVTEGSRSDDWLVRMSCVWILGATGDRRNIPAIHERLTDATAAVRYQAAASLVKLGDGRGFRPLVEGLADGDLQNRFKCFQSLKAATGKDFGFRHDGAPDERRLSVGRWLDWLEGVSASAL